jgi:hypothetical protein
VQIVAGEPGLHRLHLAVAMHEANTHPSRPRREW